jgi:transposase-like protein
VETKARRTRRVFSAAEKLRIVKKADACLASGERGAMEGMLREEGIYSSMLSTWRAQLSANSLVAALVVDKYDDGLPLHRQKRRFERMGASLAVSTLADQVMWATDLLRPLWRVAIDQVLAAKVMHLDATGLPVLDRDAAGGKRLGALWG